MTSRRLYVGGLLPRTVPPPKDRRRKASGSFHIFLRSRFIGCAILCSLALLESAAAPAASGPPVLAIHGTVVDETGAPVPNVRVAAVEGTGLMRDFYTQSDAAGNFAFDLPARFLVSFVASDATGERMDFLGDSFPARDRQRVVLRKSRDPRHRR